MLRATLQGVHPRERGARLTNYTFLSRIAWEINRFAYGVYDY